MKLATTVIYFIGCLSMEYKIHDTPNTLFYFFSLPSPLIFTQNLHHCLYGWLKDHVHCPEYSSIPLWTM